MQRLALLAALRAAHAERNHRVFLCARAQASPRALRLVAASTQAVAALWHAMAAQGTQHCTVTPPVPLAEGRQYGMLVKCKEVEAGVNHGYVSHDRGWQQHSDAEAEGRIPSRDHPLPVEPKDSYRREERVPDQVFVGNGLVRLRKRHGLLKRFAARPSAAGISLPDTPLNLPPGHRLLLLHELFNSFL